MKNLDDKIATVLGGAGLVEYARKPLIADASNRRYERILADNKTYMLMIAPPETEDVRPFIKIAEILLNAGLNAPDILARDVENGLLLLQDFGDDLFTQVLTRGEEELALYKQAVEVLEALPTTADAPVYSREKLLDEPLLYIDWLATDADKAGFVAIWNKLLDSLSNNNRLVLRDYHADNLMWLPQNQGLQRIGLLDFQDAVLGNAAYDYVSLLEDARRDVSPATVSAILRGKSEQFLLDYAILGAQRNLKIIGIFHRLFKRDGKDRYLHYLPRVWAHLHNDLRHPVLAELKNWIERNEPN
jgi:aminoglycoside/choline kinase family phosphotransferase